MGLSIQFDGEFDPNRGTNSSFIGNRFEGTMSDLCKDWEPMQSVIQEPFTERVEEKKADIGVSDADVDFDTTDGWEFVVGKGWVKA